MKVIIVEDEMAAFENLKFLLDVIPFEIEIVKKLETVKSSIDYFASYSQYDVVLMDIHLGDGVSFEIFKKVSVEKPIIFISAYDEYAIQAFKVNSIDYLLKPVTEKDLIQAFEKLVKGNHLTNNQPPIHELINLLKPVTPSFKSSFLAQTHNGLIPIKTRDIAIIRIDLGIVKAVCFNSSTHTLPGTLEEIENELNPEKFYRANRQFILNKDAISKISTNLNGKLSVATNPGCADNIIISKAKAKSFKIWLN